ncbi:hypothetical protein Amet_2126 [Alkaliphilus metalliredigens QYMF]|uniref:Uncharacterized protein n=1 Tax=Alkaliphilus metalliredigens (strain QYMF) TaxID=293826 RepID=A6TQ17_ALKMQ|nr:hypothetical protein Amet_2126 [Alkaliphilus metalliredigens QYMF]
MHKGADRHAAKERSVDRIPSLGIKLHQEECQVSQVNGVSTVTVTSLSKKYCLRIDVGIVG